MSLWAWFKGLFAREPRVLPSYAGSPEDRAVLIGINKYPTAPLFGCLSDVDNVSKFAPENRRILRDHDATTENIRDALRWLAQTPDSKRAFLWFSGHGVEVDVHDGIAQAICPIDFDWSSRYMITDREFVEIFSKLGRGVRFYWGSDSCHSGGLNERAMRRARTIAPPLWMRARVAARKAMRPYGFREMMRGVGINVAFVGACRSDQTAADTVIDGTHCGAFTYYFTRALRNLPNRPVKDVVAACRNALAENGYAQIPQVDGRVSDTFLL